VHGDAADLPPLQLQVDLVTMTANVAQVFVTDAEWGLDAAGRARGASAGWPLGLRDP